MTTRKPTPRELDVPHDEWRPNQYESVEWIDKLADAGESVALLQAKTGSGKTGVGKGVRGPVTALMSTKPLLDQYTEYGFEKLFGMASYPCALAVKDLGIMADSCVHTANMKGCPTAHECEYLIQRELLKASGHQALTYAYFLTNTSNGGWLSQADRRVLYLDEGHNIVNLLMSLDELRLTKEKLSWASLDKWDTSVFNTGLASSVQGVKRRLAAQYMEECIGQLEGSIAMYKGMATEQNPGPAKRARALESARDKIKNVLFRLETHPDIYFIDVNHDEFLVSPLTAKLSFAPRFLEQTTTQLTVLTSATFGNHKQFLRFIGMSPRTPFRDVPSNFSPEQQPVLVDSNLPKLNRKSSDADKKQWAKGIMRFINMVSPDNSGIVHVTSRAQARELATLLSGMGAENRVWVTPENLSTDQRIRAIENEVEKRSAIKEDGAIIIGWSLHEGIDAGWGKFNVLGKMPFPFLDALGMARLKFDPKLYNWSTAIMAEQASGRIRRGRECDYENGDSTNKVVAIADNSWNRGTIKSQFSDFFKSLIVEV